MKPGRISFIALIGLMAAISSPEARACQLCTDTDTMIYNFMPFLAIWFWIFIVWLAATVVAALLRPKYESKFVPVRSAVKLLVIMLVLLILGLNLLSMLYAPVLLVTAAVRTKTSPKWLVWTARGLCVALLISLPLGFTLPKVVNELDTRARWGRVLDEFRWYGAELDIFHKANNKFPDRIPRPSYDPEKIMPDPFGFEPTSCWYADIAMFVYGFDHIKNGPLAEMGYFKQGDRAWVVSRGPNLKFDVPLTSYPSRSPEEFTGMHYDPTNGTISPGDIFMEFNPLPANQSAL